MESRAESEVPEETRAARRLDCRGMICPLPVYKATQALARLQPGEILEILCTDPASLADFPALARRSGHELISARDGGGTQTFLLRKGG